MSKCCIKWCSARKNKNRPQLTLHKLPSNEAMKKKWLDIIGTENINPSIKIPFVCSLHFEETCFNRTLDVIRLYDGTVPSSSLVDHLSQSSSQTKHESQDDVDDDDIKDAPESSTEAATCSNTRDGVKKSTGDIPCMQVPLKRTVNKCNECNRYILGCRYVCVQCVDHEVCETCEARGAHLLHYVLRVPADKPHDEAKAILEKIREIINRESENKEDQEVPIDESDCVNSEVGDVRDPLEGEDSIVKIEPSIVKTEPQDFSELEPATQTDDEATAKRDTQPAEPQQRQQSRKRKASSEPHTGATPVTLPDTQIRICLDRVTEAISKRSNTQTSTSSSQNIVSSSSQIINEQTLPFPNYAVTNVGTSATLDQPGGSVVPVVTSSSRQREGGGAPRPQREHAAVQVVSLDPAPAQHLVIKVELPD